MSTEVEQLKQRLENQSLAIGYYQQKISNYERRLETVLKQSYPAPTFQATVRKIFKEIMYEKEILTGQDGKVFNFEGSGQSSEPLQPR